MQSHLGDFHLGDFCSLSGRDGRGRDPEEAYTRVGPASVVELTVCVRMLQALLPTALNMAEHLVFLS